VLVFILCVLFLSFDFYAVKNVTGRLIVGLRWWNETLEDGSNIWRFESAEDTRQVHHVEAIIFWLSLYFTPVLWTLFALTCVFRVQMMWILVPLVGFALSAANVYGYMKCAKDQRSRLQNLAQNYITNTIIGRATTSWFG